MFKKKTRASKRKGRPRRRDEEEDVQDDDDDQGSAMNAILQAKKKRKLLNAVQYQRGLDAKATLQAPSQQTFASEPSGQAAADAANKDLAERLKGTFSGGGGGGDTSSGNGVMEQKHKIAMEEYIKQNLALDNKNKAAENEQTVPPDAGEPSSAKEMKQNLYAELASSAQALSGTTSKAQGPAEVDVGSGGAMLGGTGIAEVILPVDDRIKNIKEIEAATSGGRPREAPAIAPIVVTEKSDSRVVAELPTSFAVGKGKRGKKAEKMPMVAVVEPSLASKEVKPLQGTATASSAGFEVLRSDVSGIGSSFAQNFRLQAQEWNQKNLEQQKKDTEFNKETPDELPANQERLGFEAARRAARGDETLDAQRSEQQQKEVRQQASDTRVWRQFMKRQREQQR